MRADDLREHLRTEPFEPVVLTFSDGSQQTVKHPEMIFITRSSVYVGKASDPTTGVAERFTIYSLEHLVRIDPLQKVAG